MFAGGGVVSDDTLYDQQVAERKRRGLPFECPPIFREGISRYQMTCNSCPERIKKLCIKAREEKGAGL